MDTAGARALIESLKDDGGFKWKDPLHIATDCFRQAGVLSREKRTDYTGVAAAELYLSDKLPDIDEFQGIFAVDELGIWWWDGDGDIDDPIWRQRLMPWHLVRTLVVHQLS